MTGASLLLALVLLQGSDGGEEDKCPPWHFTPASATTPCSGCSLPDIPHVYCTETSGLIDVGLIMSARNGSLFFGRVHFELDRTKWLYHKTNIFTELPSNVSELESFFCNSSNRQGFLCGRCKPGCGISIYTYYGLPCACPCYSYGIPLFILLEIGFSTLFFVVLMVLNFSANSSKWITVILFFQIAAQLIGSDTYTYTILAKSSHWVPIAIHTLYGIWNMDFLRLVIPRFCVSQGVSVLGAISTGYISAFWPLVLIVLTSLAMHLHKRNFKIVVHPWKFVNWTSRGFIQRQLAETNLIHTFATFFLLSYLKIINVSLSLFEPLNIYGIHRKFSRDPYVPFMRSDHLFYAVPAILVFTLIGMLLPLFLIFYPTRCGTWLGTRLQSGRLRNAVKTFIEAMNGSYKDGSAGTRDYRALPGLLLLLRDIVTTSSSLRADRISAHIFYFLCAAFLLLVLAAFSGVLKPYKATRHNRYDVLLYSPAAMLCILSFLILSLPVNERGVTHSVVVLMFLPLLVVIVGVLKPLVMKHI